MKLDAKKAVYLLIFLHLVISLPLAAKLNIWTDEASTLYTTKHGFFQAFQNLFSDEKQAPLYFLLMSLWRKINDSIFFARLFSIICSLLAILSFSRLAQKLWEEKTALFVTAIFAIHPYLFWASLEIRLYSLIILITCLLFSFFYDGFLSEETNKKAQIYYFLTAIAALYTNYYLGFLLVGAFFALIVLRCRTQAKTYFLWMLCVGICILPLFYIINLQFSDRIITFQEEKSLIAGIKNLWNHSLTLVLPTEIYPPEEISLFSTIRIWLVRSAILIAAVLMIKNRFKDLDKNIVSFAIISAVAAAFFLFVYFQLGTDYVESRHVAVLFVSVFLFANLVLTKFLTKNTLVFAAILYLVFFTYAMFSLYPNLTKRGDWARVAAFIEQNETENQPIVVFQVYDAISLPNYYRGKNRILPDEKFFAFFTEQEMQSPNAFRNQIEFLITEFPPEAQEIWLLTNEKCNIGRACEPLENFVQANYTIIREKDFYLEKVRLLRKK